MKMRVTVSITKRQAAALMRGGLLPYRGYAAEISGGRIVAHKPDGTFWLTSEKETPLTDSQCQDLAKIDRECEP